MDYDSRLSKRAIDDSSRSRMSLYVMHASEDQVRSLFSNISLVETIMSEDKESHPYDAAMEVENLVAPTNEGLTAVHSVVFRDWTSTEACLAMINELCATKGSADRSGVRHDINATDSQGRTSLYLAVAMNNIEAVSALLSFGASCSIADHKGLTPLKMGCLLGRESAVKILLSHNIDEIDFDVLLSLGSNHSGIVDIIKDHFKQPKKEEISRFFDPLAALRVLRKNLKRP